MNGTLKMNNEKIQLREILDDFFVVSPKISYNPFSLIKTKMILSMKYAFRIEIIVILRNFELITI